MAKRDRNKNDNEAQTKSETTTAAHVIFNDPDQPKAPVTTDNVAKTVKAAVHEEITKAFAAKERMDMSALNKLAQSPDSPTKKPKVRLKPQPEVKQDERPVKPKVRLKPKVETPDEPKEEVHTPTGISINELAEKISRQETPNRVKPKVKLKTPTPFNVVPDKQPTAAVPVVSKTVASKSAVLSQPKAEQVPNPQNLNVEGLVNRMQAEDQAVKVQKVTKPMTSAEKKHSRDEAAEYLKGLGFKPKEFQKLLDQVDHIEKTEDKVLYALKLKSNPAAKIPQAELPAAVEEARQETKLPIKVQAAESPEPKESKAKELKPDQMSLDLRQPPEPLQLKPAPGKVGPAPATPVTAPAPTLPAKAPAPNTKEDLDQAQADADKAEEEAKNKEKAQKDRDKKIEKQLEEIKNAIGSKGIFDLIAQGISGLLKGLIPTLLRPLLGLLPSMLGLLGKASLVIGVGVAAYEGTKFLLEKAGYTGETLGRFFSGQDSKFAAQEAKFQKYNNTDAIVGRLNDKLKGTGFTALGAGQYKDASGNTVKAADLPPDVQSKINVATTKAVAAPANVESKLEAQAPKAQSEMASTKIVPPPAPDAQEAPVVHVHQDNRQTTVAPQSSSSNDGGALIKVRNDEPSASGLISSIFEHPVTYGGVYRM